MSPGRSPGASIAAKVLAYVPFCCPPLKGYSKMATAISASLSMMRNQFASTHSGPSTSNLCEIVGGLPVTIKPLEVLDVFDQVDTHTHTDTHQQGKLLLHRPSILFPFSFVAWRRKGSATSPTPVDPKPQNDPSARYVPSSL